MKAKLFIVILISFLGRQVYAQDCKKCDLAALLEMSKNIDKSDYQTIKNFICTLDTSCQNNAEFSQWSNELIFKLIEYDVNMLNQTIHDLGYDYVLLVSMELENPVTECDLRKIYKLVINSIGPKDMIEVEKRAIVKAGEKEGIQIE